MNKQVSYVKKIIAPLILVSAFIFWNLNVDKYANLQLGREAIASAKGGAVELGLTNVTVSECQPSCCSAVGCTCCSNGSLCSSDTAPACLRSTVTGMPAGGGENQALFLKTSLAKVGISQGGQLLAAVAGVTMTDGGTLAGKNGCIGPDCMALNTKDMNIWRKSMLAVKYLIARVKNKLI